MGKLTEKLKRLFPDYIKEKNEQLFFTDLKIKMPEQDIDFCDSLIESDIINLIDKGKIVFLIKEIDNIINTTKIKLPDLFVNSNFTYATLDKIRNNVLVSVMRMLRDIENFKEHIDKKSYKSIEEADTEYNCIIGEYNIVIKEFERMKE